ncbi:esterase [Allopusillimonas ginsengisoli]|uniref:esterase n=1 Tax=Allopusillimonas ginsengisoli TaxID=453575 RepID=UPI0010C20CEF|nr:esterase [Allopusillimonas ginsengisoli]
MATAAKPGLPEPFVFMPRNQKPQLLFVLLHGESANPRQLFPLADAIGKAFPAAMIVLPYAGQQLSTDTQGAQTQSEEEASTYYWIRPQEIDAGNYPERVAQVLPTLIGQIAALQQSYGLTGEHTALAGFSQGASVALEAAHAHSGLAGRVLAFSGLYARIPAKAPPTTTLHFFHGADDQQISADEVEATLSRLGELKGDATLDVASGVGHELHETLINQAVLRLQTCVPLRSWEEALGTLQQKLTAPEHGQPSRKTVH